MGRRSINTTKSGKYMNPTDQARKEARKKELKKNKRQRQMVRAAVLKGKDPGQILDEMEKIDEMEYNVLQPSPLNEKVLREKRKKLKETFDRVMRLYHNDDPELWSELKRKEVDYEKKRLKKLLYYESVKSAQSVQIDEIPLPQMNIPPPGGMVLTGSLNRVPPPSVLQIPPFIPGIHSGILNKPLDYISKNPEKISEKKKKEPPGCPPGPPPDLVKFRELDSDAEDDEVPIKETIKKSTYSSKTKSLEDDDRTKDENETGKPTSLQQRMLAISGQNVDAFMKEMENFHQKKTESEHKNDNNSDNDSQKSSDDEDDDDDDIDDDDASDNSDDDDDDDEDENQPKSLITNEPSKSLSIPLPPIPPPPPAMGMPGGPPPPPMGMPPAMMFRPPPMRPTGGAIPGITMRMPPGPPPGRPGGMQMQHRMGIRMPPGPPPGMPPSRIMHHHNQKGIHHNNQQQINQMKDSKGITTITAKPQIRNLSADVTRFVPSALRVKRDDAKLPRRPKPYHQEIRPSESKKGATKDDAYMQFMREMQGLL